MAEGFARMVCEVFPFFARRCLSPPPAPHSTPPSHYYLFWEGRGIALRENAVTYANIFIGFCRSGRPARSCDSKTLDSREEIKSSPLSSETGDELP